MINEKTLNRIMIGVMILVFSFLCFMGWTLGDMTHSIKIQLKNTNVFAVPGRIDSAYNAGRNNPNKASYDSIFKIGYDSAMSKHISITVNGKKQIIQ